MYLTDFREYCLRDVIEQLEPALFRKVTGLTLKDFSLLVSLGVFNSELMNDAVYKFKRYEDSSLEYTGIDRHTGSVVGLWDTAIDTSKTGLVKDRVVDNNSEYVEDPLGGGETISRKPWETIRPGDAVTHKSLGPGTIVALDKDYLIVKFTDRESKFRYPSAFEKGYLEV